MGLAASDDPPSSETPNELEQRNGILESLEGATKYSDYIRLARRIRGRSWTGLPLTHRKLALLGSCTLDPLKPYLEALAFSWNVVLEVELLPYNQYAQQICGSQTRLWEFSPDAALLAVRLEDVAPDLYARSGSSVRGAARGPCRVLFDGRRRTARRVSRSLGGATRRAATGTARGHRPGSRR